MKESDYIAVTNLVKLRAARAALADCLFADPKQQSRFVRAVRLLDELTDAMNKKIEVEEDDE